MPRSWRGGLRGDTLQLCCASSKSSASPALVLMSSLLPLTIRQRQGVVELHTGGRTDGINVPAGLPGRHSRSRWLFMLSPQAGWTRVRAGGSWANPTGGGRASALGAEDPQHSTIDAPPTSSLHELRQHPWDPCGRSVRLEFSWAPRSLRSANGLAGGAGEVLRTHKHATRTCATLMPVVHSHLYRLLQAWPQPRALGRWWAPPAWRAWAMDRWATGSDFASSR